MGVYTHTVREGIFSTSRISPEESKTFVLSNYSVMSLCDFVTPWQAHMELCRVMQNWNAVHSQGVKQPQLFRCLLNNLVPLPETHFCCVYLILHTFVLKSITQISSFPKNVLHLYILYASIHFFWNDKLGLLWVHIVCDQYLYYLTVVYIMFFLFWDQQY